MGKVTGKDLQKLIEGALSEKITNNLVEPSVKLYTKRGKDKPPRGTSPENDKNWRDVGVKSNIKDRSNDFSNLAATTATDSILDGGDLQAAVEDMLTRLQSGEELSKSSKAYKRDQAIAAMQKGGTEEIKAKITNIIQNSFGTLDTSAHEVRALIGKIKGYFDELEYQDVDAFSSQEIPYKSVETTEAKFDKQISPKVSPYLLDLFGGIDGSSVREKLTSIAEFSAAAESRDLQSWASQRDQFSPFIYAKVLSFLANEIKTIGATEAGHFFERWLALVLNFPVVGAEGGAADNLGKVGADKVYTSSKLYTDLVGEWAPSQSTEGLKKITGKNKSVFYFVAQKMKADEQKTPGFTFIPSINLYLIEVAEDKDNEQLRGRFIKDNATTASEWWNLTPKSDTQSYITPANYESNEDFLDNLFATIYLPEGEITDQAIGTTAKFLSDRVGEITNQPATRAILDAATKIKTIEANTDSYVGKSKQKKGSATDYIDEIYADYDALEDLYRQIFAYGEGDEQPEISENKITQEHIIKLIEESFKK